MNIEPHIRNYVLADHPYLLELLRLNTPKYFSPEEKKDLINYLDHEVEEYFVVEQAGRIIGCGGINFEDSKKVGKISWDILHTEFQGKGIGSLLLNYRINLLKNMDSIEKISVRTSQLVYRFYEKNGFELIEVKKDYWAKGFDLYNMIYREI